MPRKRPVNNEHIDYLQKTISQGYSSLILVKSILSGYLNKDAAMIVELNDLCRRYSKFKKEAFADILVTENTHKAISPLNPEHPAYGLCPQCSSAITLVRDEAPERLCLECSFTELFEDRDLAKVGWKPCAKIPPRLEAYTDPKLPHANSPVKQVEGKKLRH